MCRFIIQKNLLAENDINQIQQICKNNLIPFEDVFVIPFVDDLPEFTIDEIENFYYGSTSFITKVYQKYKPKGIFFNPDTFLISNYIDKWKDHMLNSNAEITTLEDFLNKKSYLDDKQFFVRPNADDKSFDGNVMTYKQLGNWNNNMLQFDDTKLSPKSIIIVSEPYNIKKEWRLYVVNGEVVSGSQYRENFKLKKDIFVPNDVIDFAHDRIKEYSPSTCFAMDVCLCGDSLYIVECGCINSVGFYAADKEKILLAIKDHIRYEI